MTETEFLIVRIIPTRPVGPTAFRKALNKITITARDKRVADANHDRYLGEASGLAGEPEDQPVIPPNPPTGPKIPGVGHSSDPEGIRNAIIQHYDVRQFKHSMYSVATAVVIINREDLEGPDKEYPRATSYDVALELVQDAVDKTVASRQTIVDYNVKVRREHLSDKQEFYMKMDTDVYLSIDVPVAPLFAGTAVVSLSREGVPPDFDSLREAINSVIELDSSDGADSLESMTQFLSTGQAKQIAAELTTNRLLDPPPAAPYRTSTGADGPPRTVFENMYTISDDGGTVPQEIEQARIKFEGARASYYGLRSSDAIQLANYVYSVIAAVYAEWYTSKASYAVLQVPIQAEIHHKTAVAMPSLALMGNDAGLVPPFTVPAAYFYALMTTYAISQDFDTRMKLLLTSPKDTLTTSLNLAIDAGVLGPRSTEDNLIHFGTTLNSSDDVNINELQALRRIVALQASVRHPLPGQVQPSMNDTVKKVVTSWLDFEGQDSDLASEMWYSDATDYLVIVLQIIAPGDEPLISAMLEDLRKAPTDGNDLGEVVQSAEDLLDVTEQQWFEFFGRHPDLLPDKYLLGDLQQRVHAFVQDITKVIFVFPPPQTDGGSGPQPITPGFAGSLAHDVLVHFLNSYSFSFSDPMDDAKLEDMKNAAMVAFDENEVVVSFVVSAVAELWLLYRVTELQDEDDPSKTISNELRFSYMEALHARGFTNAASIQSLSQAVFISAMSGTAAYIRAGNIHDEALKLPLGGGRYNPEPGRTFKPINGGALTDCVPVCHLSPFGPVQYLSHLLKFSFNEETIANLLISRCGPCGNLLATEENLNAVVPIVDIVNENLESLVAGTSPAGVIYNTKAPGSEGLDHPNGAAFTPSRELGRDDILRALPQHSTPKLPLTQPEAYEKLKNSVAGVGLPYSRGIDFSETYLGALGSSRYETMRTFSRDITELAQDATKEPSDFQRHLFRLPVRRDIAITYIGVSPKEAELLFSGNMTASMALDFLGIRPTGEEYNAPNPLLVSRFIAVTGISYCEFLNLHRSNFVKFIPRKPVTEFPECLPCCDESLFISFVDDSSPEAQLLRLAIFVRLWRRVSQVHSDISMSILADICNVLGLFTNQNVNPEFLRQLASLIMLQAEWRLPWTNVAGSGPSSTVPDQRTMILSIWSGRDRLSREVQWAVQELLQAIERHSMATYNCPKRSAEAKRLLSENLDTIAHLVGFNGDHQWYSQPTSTIRFLEVLSKVYASGFTVGELLFLFTTQKHLRSDDPFPHTEDDESLDDPFNVPEDDKRHGLWSLRRSLLHADVCDSDVEMWTWPRIEAMLHKVGYAPHDGEIYSLQYLAEHFFPEILAEFGRSVPDEKRRFSAPISGFSTASTWAPINACSPFFYSVVPESKSSLLWAKLPLCDDQVLKTLRSIRQLSATEASAIQRIYLQPRTALAPFALLFSNFNEAADFLTQETCVYKRFRYFQRQIAIFYKRCTIIARHISEAVAAAMGTDCADCHPGGCNDEHDCDSVKVAWRILLSLIADENRPATSWESADDRGDLPTGFDWQPRFSGSAFAALLGLSGMGIEGMYYNSRNANVWKETRGGLEGWGSICNSWNSPLPTILPALTLTPSEAQDDLIAFKNGFAFEQATGDLLSGAEPFIAIWGGTLLIDKAGCYSFAFSCPAHARGGRNECDGDCEKLKRWSVRLQRGQKVWNILDRGILEIEVRDGIPDHTSRAIPLRRGAYQVTMVLQQPEPIFDDDDDLRRMHTGFCLSYKGEDTDNCMNQVPLQALYIDKKDGPLWGGQERARAITDPLNLRYVPTIRDIRRTYQRAFKSVLLAQRFCLSAKILPCERQSELGFLLQHPAEFVGTSYYWDNGSGTFKTHQVNFDLNFLPVSDAFHSPEKSVDARVEPSQKRQSAMFDWWERVFDYVHLRGKIKDIREPDLWLLFYHALSDSPQPVNHLLRFLGIDITLAPLALEYFEQPSSLFRIADSENIDKLGDERWVTRAWHAGRWLRRLQQHFYTATAELELCRPALWATYPDPDVVVIDDISGNVNLLRFVQRSCLGESNVVARHAEVVKLNDGLRLRARQAMLEYLLSQGFQATDLSDTLLIDVEAGISDATTRIAESVSAAQRFVQRVLLGLEPALDITSDEAERWDCMFATFEKWKLLQKKVWYYENWIQWDESTRLKKSEAYASLIRALRSDITTVATVSRNAIWPGATELPPQPGKETISGSQKFSLKVQKQALDEGVALMGPPNRSARPTWLAPIRPKRSRGPYHLAGNNQRQLFSESEAHANADASKHLDSPLTPESDSEDALPAAASLEYIPLWIQAALQMGVRFIRVAASGLPVAAPYDEPNSSSIITCGECGKEHPPVMDEYYFWLQDGRRFDPAQVPAPQNADQKSQNSEFQQPREGTQIDPRTIQADPTSDWDNPTPQMLWWQSTPIVHLHWTRVHMGLLQEPHRSTEGIPLDDDASLSDLFLNLRGRQSDSLLFNVKAGDSSIGFRYDIATDAAIPIPEPVPSDPPSLPLPPSLKSSLASFPYFLYFRGGAPLVPLATYGAGLVISRSLRENCRYLPSINWLRATYDPLGRDNTWMQCRELSLRQEPVTAKLDIVSGSKATTDLFSSTASFHFTDSVNDKSSGAEVLAEPRFPQDRNCCDTAPVAGGKARGRAATLEYIETLLLWADSLFAQNSQETYQKALTILSVASRVLGPKPRKVQAADLTEGKMTVAAFQSSLPPLNPRLTCLYEAVDDRLSLIRRSFNSRRLPGGVICRDLAAWGSAHKFGDKPECCGPSSSDSCGTGCLFICSQGYRFNTILARAVQWVAMVKSTGAALMSAFERGDNEALSGLKSSQERQITELGRDVSQNQYRAADWDVQALDKQMESATTKLEHYQKLIREGLNFNEMGFIFGTTASMASRTSANISESVGQGMATTPDMWVGIAGTMGTPLQFQQMPMGVKLGTGFAAAARILNTVADVSSSAAGLHSGVGGWDRREQEWRHQADLTVYEIQQIKRQRLAARRRLEISLRELNNTERRIEHLAETQAFLTNKFTKYELCLYLQQENSALYRKLYNTAFDVCHEAQQAARYELGDTNLDIIPLAANAWDSLHEGLLAGEKLELALNSLERAYMNNNCREYELVKHVSLRLHFPAAFVLLKSTGYCEVDIPEWLFDLDYPGQYMRRIKSVSLTIPCVAGPYSGVHCRLQQLRSSIRVRPSIGECKTCRCEKPAEGNNPCSCIHDPEVATRFAGTEAIATSSGQNDSGLFEINFNDPRYLPFEYTGAVSRWRIELPPENNQFDLDSLSDLVMHVNYTAREGGPDYRKNCQELAQKHLSENRLRFFDIKHEMPEVWSIIRQDEECKECKREKESQSCCNCEERQRSREWACSCDDGSANHNGCDEDWDCAHPATSDSMCKKKRRRHNSRSFQISLTRQMFPFMPGCSRSAVTMLEIFLDTDDCCDTNESSKGAFEMIFTLAEDNDCPDTQKVPFIRTAGGIWKGRLKFPTPILIDGDGFHKTFGFRAKKNIGTFSVPCGLKNVSRAWMLCLYDTKKV
ncbi:hypothetical protein K4F52_001065 [Lecanicillium sp. MT-2017a]|nr:hypothetical protein K4F52_001065 [Lecanicillium sp. MT-2017a]